MFLRSTAYCVMQCMCLELQVEVKVDNRGVDMQSCLRSSVAIWSIGRRHEAQPVSGR